MGREEVCKSDLERLGDVPQAAHLDQLELHGADHLGRLLDGLGELEDAAQVAVLLAVLALLVQLRLRLLLTRAQTTTDGERLDAT